MYATGIVTMTLCISVKMLRTVHMTNTRRTDIAAIVENSCFSELLPTQLGLYSHLRTFERCAQLFKTFVGVRGGLKMGSTNFRTFVRYSHAYLSTASTTLSVLIYNSKYSVHYIYSVYRHLNRWVHSTTQCHTNNVFNMQRAPGT